MSTIFFQTSSKAEVKLIVTEMELTEAADAALVVRSTQLKGGALRLGLLVVEKFVAKHTDGVPGLQLPAC